MRGRTEDDVAVLRARFAAVAESGTWPEIERAVIELQAALGGTAEEVAKRLGLSQSSLYMKLRKHGLADMRRRREERRLGSSG